MIALIVLGYLAVGIVVAFVGPAARSIDDAYRDAAAESPTKAQALRAMLVVTMAVLWPVMLPSAIKTRRLEAEQRSNSLFGFFDAMAADGVDADVIPGATGDFGLTATNPIPTRTPLGSEAYLKRLRTSNGETISWSRLGSTIADGIEKPIDAYEIRTPSGDRLATLYVSPYHKRNSQLAPKGFRFGSGPFEPETDAPPAESEEPPPNIAEHSPGSQQPPPAESTKPTHTELSAEAADRASEAGRIHLEVGLQYLNGSDRSAEILTAAKHNLDQAAKLGLAEAHYHLADAYRCGIFGSLGGSAPKLALAHANLGAELGYAPCVVLKRLIEDKYQIDLTTVKRNSLIDNSYDNTSLYDRREKTTIPTDYFAEARKPPLRIFRAPIDSVAKDKLDLTLYALGARVGKNCIAIAKRKIVKTLSNPSAEAKMRALEYMANRWAARRGYLSMDSEAGMEGLVDGADAQFEERRAVFIAGVQKGLADDDDDEVDE